MNLVYQLVHETNVIPSTYQDYILRPCSQLKFEDADGSLALIKVKGSFSLESRTAMEYDCD